MANEAEDVKPVTSLVKPPKAQIARSVATARKGELIYLDTRGRVVSKLGLRVRYAAMWTWAAACWTYAGVSVGWVSGALAGAGVVLFGMAATARYMIYAPAIRRANALLANHRREEASAAFLALEKRRLPRAIRRSVSAAIGSLDVCLGRPEQGLVRIDAALAQLRRPWFSIRRLQRWRLSMVRASVLALLGRHEEARRQRDDAQAKIHPRVLASDYGQLLTQSVALDLAFHADTPETLPNDAVLHEWARAALARTVFGMLLVELAWAFHRRGDDDMARHVLAESASRLPNGPDELRQAAPRLAAWAEDKRAAWGIVAAADADADACA
jgi:hypothetical protein